MRAEHMRPVPDSSEAASATAAAVRELVIIGASAGGIAPLREFVGRLPATLAAPVLVVLHVPGHRTSVLPHILSRAGRLPALHPDDGERARNGRIYVAPPDRHMLIRNGRLVLVRGPRENNQRPSIDALLRSAAVEYGPRAIGVLLSGTLYDGTAGLFALKAAGGLAAVQDPDEAAFPDMLQNALAQVDVDHTERAGPLGSLVARLVGEPVEPAADGRPDHAAGHAGRDGDGAGTALGAARQALGLRVPRLQRGAPGA